MSKESERLPRPAQELEELASYYDDHDTADEMADGQWVEPMVTTSLRLPRDVFEQLKENARREGKRHTAYIREILEHSLEDADSGELAEIRTKVDELLRTVKSQETAKVAAARKKTPSVSKRTTSRKPPA